MPYISKRVPAEELMTYMGITIYYAYNHDEFEEPLQNLYTVVDDPETDTFDVRDLPNYGKNPGTDSRGYHADVIREAISHGYLDEHLMKMYVHPKQGWPKQWQDCTREQFVFLLKSYEEHIDDAEFVCDIDEIQEFYDGRFKQRLEEATIDEIGSR